MKTGKQDWVEISNLCVNTHIGVFDWEQRRPRPLLINLRLHTSLSAAGCSDDLAKTIDYASVCQQIQDFAGRARVALVEAFAEQLSSQLLQQLPVDAVALTITKPMAVVGANVSIHIERSATTESA